MEELLIKIRQPIIFYLPRRIFEERSGKDLRVLDKLGVTSNLLIIDKNGKINRMETVYEPFSIVQKEKDLKSNIFELLKMRETLGQDTFLFLLDNYLVELATYINLAQIVLENAKEETVNYIPEIQGYLELQHRYLKDHKSELDKHFGYWRTRIELERVFKLAPPPLDDNRIDNGQKTVTGNVKETSTGNVKTTSKKLSNEYKKILVTEEDVDMYLLGKVFNIKLSSKKLSC